MFQVLLYLDFPLNLVNEVVLNHLNLLHRLKSIDLARGGKPCSPHHAKGTLAERTSILAIKKLEVIKVQLLSSWRRTPATSI